MTELFDPISKEDLSDKLILSRLDTLFFAHFVETIGGKVEDELLINSATVLAQITLNLIYEKYGSLLNWQEVNNGKGILKAEDLHEANKRFWTLMKGRIDENREPYSGN
jgi:hypothetical protein